MSRIYQSGAEAGLRAAETSGAGTGINVSTTQTFGAGTYSYVIGSPNVSGQIDTGVGYSMAFPNTTSINNYYFKSDVYIDNIADQGNDLSFFPFFAQATTDQAVVLIYNSGGTLYAVVQYNSNNIYWYDAGYSHSSVVPLGVGFDTWFRLEIHFDSSGAAGTHSLEIKVDGVSILNDTGLTFTSTTTSGINAGASNLSGSDDQAMVVYMDNIAVNSSSGSINNSWVGEEYIVRAMPDGAGDSNPTAGTYASINEIPATTTASSSANRIEIDNTSDYGWFTISNPGLNNTDHQINAVSVPFLVRENSAGTSSYNTGIKSESAGREYYANGLYYPDLSYVAIGGLDAGDTTVRTSPNGTINYEGLLISQTDPTTNTRWKATGTNSIDNAQIGIRKVSGTPNIWATWAGAMIAYSPATPQTNRGMLIMFW